MNFIGIIGIDGGGMNLNSRRTLPMSFEEVSRWFISSIEYFQGSINYDREAQQIILSVYREEDIYSVTAEPIGMRIIVRTDED